MSRRPVVVLEALSVRSEPTGVAGAAGDLVTALAASDRGLDFVIVAAAPDAFAGVAGRPGWRVVVGPAAGGDLRRAWYVQRGMPALCRAVGADVLHCLQPVAPARPGCGLAVTVHDLAWRVLPQVVRRSRRLYYDAVIPRGWRSADLLLASSAATAAGLASAFPDLATRIRVTPLGTPTWIGRTPLPAPGGAQRPYFLFVGAREPRKNLPRLLDAYERLVAGCGAQAPGLVLAGPEGWLDGPLRERLARPALQGHVDIRGYCEPAALRALYGGALALVFPSLLEGFGLPILEAMACGLPVLTSDCGATAEVAGHAALLVDPHDTGAMHLALARLADDALLRARLAAGGPQRAREWTWERTADLTTGAYREILRLPRRR